jgi:hypothetical protein
VVLKKFERDLGHFESERWHFVGPAPDRKDFATHFPDMSPTPLNNMGGRH